jgi:HlyD family secretion protein
MSLIALPTTESRGAGRWMVWLLAPAAAIVAVAALWAFTTRSSSSTVAAGGGAWHRVLPADLEVKLVKDGELQAINNIEIQSTVEGQTTVQTLVKEGASVKKGDVLITLDSSTIKQKIEDTTLDLQKAEADATNAREMRAIQESQNNANLEAAQVALQLARLDLQQYTEGSYPQQVANAQTDLDMAQINLKNKEEKLGQTKALLAKGFVTSSAVKDDEIEVTTARNNYDKAQTALKVLTDYTHQMDLAEKQNAVAQADQKLARTQRENAASMAQKNADVQAKDQALAVLKRRMEHLQEQLDGCTIKAPADGMVVYATSNDRNAQSSLQEGSQVRERQALLRLPDTSSMKAVVRIPEGQVARLREGLRARVTVPSVPTPIGATLTRISVLADNSQRWMNPDLKEYPVDLVLDYTPPSLKPGMGVNANVMISHARDVLTVPLTAIYSVGPDSYVFLRDGDNETRPRKVKLGAINETHAQIVEGLSSGTDVKILEAGEGQRLLERAGIKATPPPSTQPDDMDPRNIPGGNRTRRPDGMPPGASDQFAPSDSTQHPNGDAPQRPGRGNGRRGGRGGTGDGAPRTPAPSDPKPDTGQH